MATVALIQRGHSRHRGSYLEALRDLPEVSAAAVVDPEGATFEEVRRVVTGKPLRTYASFGDLLRGERERPAMVIATLTGAEAPEFIQPVLEAGIPVLAEKPACADADSFARLVDVSLRREAPLMLALANRSAPWAQDARRIVREGGVGRLYAARAMTLADQGRIWDERTRDWSFRRAEVGGGYLIWLGIHFLDMLLYLTGERVEEVEAQTANVGGAPIDVEDLATVNLRLRGGALGSLLCGYVLDTTVKQIDVSLWGTAGSLRFDMVARHLAWHSAAAPHNESRDRDLRYDAPGGGYTPFVRECLRAALGEVPPPITSEEGLHVLRTIFAAYESAATGRAVKVPA